MLVCTSCGAENPEGFRFCGSCAAPLATQETADHEVRKTVTVVFCDVTGSTALGERLDPESLRRVMLRYFESMKQVVVRHGGTVEKFIGDAVMAVFGVPVLHEDDALRAVRAAAQMVETLGELNEELARTHGTRLQARIGVNTGEVVTGTEERLAAGDAVNVAARLEQAAEPGEVLLGDETLRLTRAAVDVEPVDLPSLKGKSEPVPAFRLLGVSHDAPVRPLDAPMVGRQQELDRLRDAFAQAVHESSCQLFTILGAAGVGKSRLVAAFLSSLERATVLRGRCLPYGDGITYWPVVEVVKQLPDLRSLALDAPVAETLCGLLDEQATPTTSEEIAWAFRKLLEAVSREQPLVCVFDDVQWGEETFLDLIEHLAYLSRSAPILLVCIARPDLLDRRPGWPAALRLEPLSAQHSEWLVAQRLGEREVESAQHERILSAAGGNPLFLEEMVTMLLESDEREVAVPPTMQALLSARLDQLGAAERAVLERGAVEGEIFHRGAVQALGPDETQLMTRLTALVRKELLRPDKPQIAGDDAFRFRHILIRDAAYAGMPKATRADLHGRFADWLDGHARDLVELDELLGYHLEQAYRYRVELGPEDESARALAARAGEKLAAAGDRASMRWDLRAAIRLQERAVSLLGRDDPRRLRLLFELGHNLSQTRESEREQEVLNEAIEAARAAGDPGTEAQALLASLHLGLERDPEGVTVRAAEGSRRAIQTFEELGDERGLAEAWQLLSRVHGNRGEPAAEQEALGRALTHARNAGATKHEAVLRIGYALRLLSGSAPLADVSRYQQQNLEWARARGSPRVEAASLVLGGRLLAMRGEFDQGRALIARGRALFDELGITVALLAVSTWSSEVEELAGDIAAAERDIRVGLEIGERVGDTRTLQEFTFEVARLADLQGRYDEAEELTTLYEQEAASADRWLRVMRRCRQGRVMARRGEADEAAQLAHEAVGMAPPPDAILDRSHVLMDAAGTLSLAGHPEQAAPLIEEALELYERKGSLVSARQARKELEILGECQRFESA